MKKKMLLFSCIIVTTTSIFGQTQSGIGINTTTPATSLHVSADPNSTNADGIIAPNLTRQELRTRSSNYNTTHKGAIVYITEIGANDPKDTSGKTDLIQSSGYYYFDGTKFQIIGGGGPWLSQENNLPASQIDADIYKLGRVAIGTTTTTDNSQLYVEGNTKITRNVTLGKSLNDTMTINSALVMPHYASIAQDNSVALVIDKKTGSVGTALSAPSLILFAQKRLNQRIQGTELTNFNAGSPVVVKWDLAPVANEEGQDFSNEPSDIVTNNLDIDLDPTTGEFLFNTSQPQQFEISGYVNYIARCSGSVATLNIVVQVKRNGTSEWLPFTGARIVFSNPSFAQTSVFSPAADWFNPGDAIRLVVLNPHAGTASMAHGYNNAIAGILRPVGLKYLASFKITAL